MTFLNGQLMSEPQLLKTGSRIILGNNHVFRFTHPEQGQQYQSVHTALLLCNSYVARALRATGSAVTSLIGEYSVAIIPMHACVYYRCYWRCTGWSSLLPSSVSFSSTWIWTGRLVIRLRRSCCRRLATI